MAYAVLKHKFTNLKKYELVKTGRTALFGLITEKIMVPVYAENCLVCGRSKENHELSSRLLW